MNILYNPVFLKHETGDHPENKKRLLCLGHLEETPIENGEKYLSLVHTPHYIHQVKAIAEEGGGYWDVDTFISAGSYEAAIYAAGAAVMASERNDFALVRPPGHHAYPSHASGFCLFNNVAIAAKKLVNEGKKVLLFDFDGHCGDGTEKIFYDSEQVLYWSLHQYPAFPGIGTEDEIGEGKGKGYTINVPLQPESSDDVYWKAVDALMPIAKQFSPDVVAVSAGFDAHQSDPLLNLRLSLPTYYKLGQRLTQNFPKVFAVLEGGYNLECLPKCLYNFLDGVNGLPMRFKEESTVSPGGVISIFESRLKSLKKNLSSFWKLRSTF